MALAKIEGKDELEVAKRIKIPNHPAASEI